MDRRETGEQTLVVFELRGMTDGARSLSLQLSQAEHSRYIETGAPEGDFFYFAYFAPSASFAYATLTREIERMPAADGWLEFKAWHDTEAHEEVGFAAVSVDGGCVTARGNCP